MLLIIVLVIIGILIIWIITLYNRLVGLRNSREKVFADIDFQLHQRHDLIPHLVETIKGYASHKKDLLIKVTESRTSAMAATTIDDKILAEQQLSASLQRLNLQAEEYPELKANQDFFQLQKKLGDIENKLVESRKHFNDVTTEYNKTVESFPYTLVAGNSGFKKEVLFEEQSAEMETGFG